jgi:hypothetical protein
MSHVGICVEVWYTGIDIIRNWTTNTNVSYSIDGAPRGVKEYKPTNLTDYIYDQLLLRVDGLPNIEHTLRVDVQLSGVLLVRLFGNWVGGSKLDFLFSLITSLLPKRLSTWKRPQPSREHLA